MDDSIDLTLYSLFSRHTNPHLMLDVERHEWQRNKGNSKLTESRSDILAQVMGSVIPIPRIFANSSEDYEHAESLGRIFNDPDLMLELEGCAYWFGRGENCDECGSIADALNRGEYDWHCRHCANAYEETQIGMVL